MLLTTWVLSLGVFLAVGGGLVAPGAVRAQSTPDESRDDEVVPTQGREYAWGERERARGPSAPAVHRDAFVYGTLGVGGTLRLYYDEALHQGLAAPVYLQLRGAYFFEGSGDFQHGIGLGIATNLTADPTDLDVLDGFLELGQWTLAPSYFLRIWLSDAFQLMGHFGVPVGLSSSYQAFGLELGVGGMYKFLSGFGIYLQAVFSTYFATFAQPMLSADAGFVFDFEVLP